MPENPLKEGYTFVNWTVDGVEYLGGEIRSDLDIIANFEEIHQEEPISDNPTSNVTIDFSEIIPYLILISASIILLIEINFIRSLFKSRR